MSERKFYRTVYQVEVLSEEPYNLDNDLDCVVYDITEGHCNGNVEIVVSNDEMDGLETVRRLMDSGSDPLFFRLTEEGSDDSEELAELNRDLKIMGLPPLPQEG